MDTLSLSLTMPELTFEQAAMLKPGDSVYSRCLFNKKGEPYRHRVSSVRRWKRNPKRIEVKVVYGLKIYTTIDQYNLDDFSLSDGTVEDDNAGVQGLQMDYLNALTKGGPRSPAIEEAWHLDKTLVKDAVKAGRLAICR